MTALPIRGGGWVKPTIVLLSIVLLLSTFAPVAAFSGSGAGTSGDPYQVTTCSQLHEMNASLTSGPR